MPVTFDDSALRPCAAEFMWCVHCERAFQYGQARDEPGTPTCPYVGCEKNHAEPWDWVRVHRLNPDYPRLPTPGVVYPLFGRGTYVRG
jgi:hypothetical protein